MHAQGCERDAWHQRCGYEPHVPCALHARRSIPLVQEHDEGDAAGVQGQCGREETDDPPNVFTRDPRFVPEKGC